MRRHLTFANVLSLLALFFALSGGSYAAVSAVSSDPAPAVITTTTTTTTTGFDATELETSVGTADPADIARAPAHESPDPEPPAQAAAVHRDPEHSEPVEPAEPAGEQDDEESHGEAGGGGPPPWAPAHGYRCKQDGFEPGSDEFVDCVHPGHP